MVHTAVFLSALFLSSLKLGESISPFGLSLCASLPLPFSLSAGFGATLGYILTESSVSALRYIASLLCVLVLHKLLTVFDTSAHAKVMPALIGFFVSFLTAAAVLTAEGFTLGGFGFMLLESLGTFFLTFAFTLSADGIQTAKRTHEFTPSGLFFGGFAVYLLLFSVADLAVYGVSFSRMFGIFLLLLFAKSQKELGGALLGVAMTAAFLLDESVGTAAFAYALGGVAAGFAAHDKPYKCVLAFWAVYTLSLFTTGGGTEKLYLLLEAVGGACLFLLTPKKIQAILSGFSKKQVQQSQKNPQRAEVLLRLSRAQTAMGNLADTVQTANELLNPMPCVPGEEAILRAKSEVCESCPNRELCREKYRQESDAAFAKLKEDLKENRLLTRGDLSPVFSSRCLRTDALCESLNRHFIHATEYAKAERRVRTLRTVTAENFKNLCAVFEELRCEVASEICFDTDSADRMVHALRTELDLEPYSISCTEEENRLFADLLFTPEQHVPERQREITECLEAALSIRLNPLVFNKNEDGKINLRLCERTKYCIEAAASGIVPENGKYSGDSYLSFLDGHGNYIAILSDGMGQGMRAAADSALAVTFAETLLKGGVSPEGTLRSANALLISKSAEESLATLDILKINLYTGKAVFYKAGAAKSLIKRGDKIREIEKPSLAAGILSDITFARADGVLLEDDVVVLASDGAFDYAEAPVEAALRTFHDEPCREIAEMLSKIALDNAPEGHADDITVLALRFQKNAQF